VNRDFFTRETPIGRFCPGFSLYYWDTFTGQRQVEQVRGFPVPLTYAIRSSLARTNTAHLIDNARSVTFAFFAEELWAALPDADRQLLEIAALLPATRLIDYEHVEMAGAMERLRSLTDRIAFITLSSDHVLSVHDLFRDFVRQRLKWRSPSSRQARYAAASALLFVCKRYDEAFQVLIDSESLPDLLEALEDFAKHISDISVKQRIISAKNS
jgi:ATP/maltotriose-dependent transcriptional regulator MalT